MDIKRRYTEVYPIENRVYVVVGTDSTEGSREGKSLPDFNGFEARKKGPIEIVFKNLTFRQIYCVFHSVFKNFPKIVAD